MKKGSADSLVKQVFVLNVFCGVFFFGFTFAALFFWQAAKDMLATAVGSEFEEKLAVATASVWELLLIMSILVSAFSLWTAVTLRRVRRLTLSASKTETDQQITEVR